MLYRARARAGEVSIFFGGNPPQLAAQLFRGVARVNFLLNSYRGNAPVAAAYVRSEVSVVFGGMAHAQPQVGSQRTRVSLCYGLLVWLDVQFAHDVSERINRR